MTSWDTKATCMGPFSRDGTGSGMHRAGEKGNRKEYKCKGVMELRRLKWEQLSILLKNKGGGDCLVLCQKMFSATIEVEITNIWKKQEEYRLITYLEWRGILNEEAILTRTQCFSIFCLTGDHKLLKYELLSVVRSLPWKGILKSGSNRGVNVFLDTFSSYNSVIFYNEPSFLKGNLFGLGWMNPTQPKDRNVNKTRLTKLSIFLAVLIAAGMSEM